MQQECYGGDGNGRLIPWRKIVEYESLQMAPGGIEKTLFFCLVIILLCELWALIH